VLTATPASEHARTTDPGVVRGLTRLTDPDGFFLVCALDHVTDFVALLPPGTPYTELVALKDAIVRAFAPHISAFLLDPEYAAGQVIASGALTGRLGLISGVEDVGYLDAAGKASARLRAGWGPRKIRLLGGDAAKLLWFYRPDDDPALAAQQREVLRRLHGECHDLHLPLVVEPIWYPLPGEDPAAPGWRSRRADGIVASARDAAEIGLDLLKAEFPGDVGSDTDRERAAAACADLDAAVPVPWVLLSAGIGFDAFATQLEIATAAGASGFMAGRSIWRDVVSTQDPDRRAAALGVAADRLARLAELTRRHGRPYRPGRPVNEVVAALPEGWYQAWGTPHTEP
jgi:tagatose 1,6-diphosphate aldolase